MFGRVVEVELSDRTNRSKPYVFRFCESEQNGEKSNCGRISFQTMWKWSKSAVRTAQIDLYNLNDEVWNWICAHGGNWSSKDNPLLISNLNIKLSVGWNDFGTPTSLWQIFSGTANSFYMERKGVDNIFHFYCGMIPTIKQAQSVPVVVTAPSIDNKTGQTINSRRWILTQSFISYMVQRFGVSYFLRTLNMSLADEHGAAAEKKAKLGYANGDFYVKFRFPEFEQNGLTNTQEYKEAQAWLDSRANSWPENTKGNWEAWLQDFCLSEGAQFGGYSEEDSDFVSTRPTLVCNLCYGKMPKELTNPKMEVPETHKIYNYEMLIQPPQLTNFGVEIASLMRPWVKVQNLLKLVITDDATIGGQSVKEREQVWAANMSNNQYLYSSTWGPRNAVFDALKAQGATQSFLNIALLVKSVQHIGDTHKKDWYSYIHTYAPGQSLIREQ